MSLVHFKTQETNLNLIRPSSIFAFNLERYQNYYENFQLQTVTFGAVLACLTVLLKYTYFNGYTPWLRFSRKVLDWFRPRIEPLRCLFGLWVLPTFKYAFEMDVLIYFH